MKPSAKRAFLLPAWPERKLYWRAAGFLGLRPATDSGGADGWREAFSGLTRPGSGAAGWRWGASLVAVAATESVRWGEGRDGAVMTEATRAQQAQGMRSAGTKRRMHVAQHSGGSAGSESDGRHRGGWLGWGRRAAWRGLEFAGGMPGCAAAVRWAGVWAGALESTVAVRWEEGRGDVERRSRRRVVGGSGGEMEPESPTKQGRDAAKRRPGPGRGFGGAGRAARPEGRAARLAVGWPGVWVVLGLFQRDKCCIRALLPATGIVAKPINGRLPAGP